MNNYLVNLLSRSWLAGTVFCVAAIAAADSFSMEPALEKIQRDIEKRHHNVRHIAADEFTSLDKSSVIVFDVRKQTEYDVSHLKDAIRVDPGIKPGDFMLAHSKRLEGKTVVFYCSVGRRSSELASRVTDLIQDEHAKGSYNLEGGLFNWSNKGLPLVNRGQATPFIHPYNIYWGRLIQDKETIRYKGYTP